jgi:hypothetical protein
MRKLLLATAATFGATLALTGGAMAQPVKPVAPGTVVVHVNGYLQFEFGDFGSSVNTVVNSTGTYKLNPVTTDGDARLYGGFDAQSVEGLDYGAQIELRTTASDAGVGAGKVTGAGSSTGTESLYVKRAYGYIGSPDSGFIRVGQGDGPFSLLQTGVVEAFGDGAQFNTDGGLASLLPTEATPGNFIYADASALYATDKIVFLSPAVNGLSAGFGYEPNSNGLKEGYGSCSTAASLNSAGTGTACADETSSPLTSDIGKRRKNTVDAEAKYAYKGDGYVITAGGGFLYGAPVDYTGPKLSVGSNANALGYDALQVYQAGAQIVVAGVTLGANVKGGQVEDSYTFKPKGARDALTYIVGASYVMGPFVLGGSFYDGQSAGTFYPKETFTSIYTKKVTGVAHTLSEFGGALGANYVISPNLSLFTQYLYGHKKQLGNSGLVNQKDGQVQAVGAGATFKW